MGGRSTGRSIRLLSSWGNQLWFGQAGVSTAVPLPTCPSNGRSTQIEGTCNSCDPSMGWRDIYAMAEGSGLWLQYSGSCALVQEVIRSTKKRGRAVGSICAIANRAALPLTCSNNRGPPWEAVGPLETQGGPPCEAVGSICAIANRAALPLTCSNNRGPPWEAVGPLETQGGPPCEAVGSICAIANRAALPLTCSNNSDIGADNNLGLTTVLGAVDLNFEIVAIPACPLEAGKSKSVEWIHSTTKRLVVSVQGRSLGPSTYRCITPWSRFWFLATTILNVYLSIGAKHSRMWAVLKLRYKKYWVLGV